eukprot:TRINITY_DN966_c0_g1_i1.p1 TRINITY_DN966_c0_g1~~TRINITY_DN966_c0_g1_i1.p1  ORF type:complete len:351 (-),score=66.61 TRINITY_DN966_c0_g1_i1:204-1256(-)
MQSYPEDELPKVKKEIDVSTVSRSPKHVGKTSRKSVDISPSEVQDKDDCSFENTSNQLVLYDPGSHDTGQVMPVPDPTEYPTPPFPSFSAPNPSSRVLPSVGAFTVQCATCFKWRFIPTKEKYEEIRERILQEPFVCETAREWRPDISCDDPADLSQDGSRLWAIDKPNISQPPPGWQRLLRIRGEGSTKFADVYYVAPSGKKLRSMVEVQKFLLENPEHIRAGVNMSQFSYQIPKPLQENYVRKRPARVMHPYDGTGIGMMNPIEPAEVNPLSWAGPDGYSDLQISRPGLPDPYYEPPVFHPPAPPKKKQATRPPPKQMYSSSVYNNNQPTIKLEEPQQPTRNATGYNL